MTKSSEIFKMVSLCGLDEDRLIASSQAPRITIGIKENISGIHLSRQLLRKA